MSILKKIYKKIMNLCTYNYIVTVFCQSKLSRDKMEPVLTDGEQQNPVEANGRENHCERAKSQPCLLTSYSRSLRHYGCCSWLEHASRVLTEYRLWSAANAVPLGSWRTNTGLPCERENSPKAATFLTLCFVQYQILDCMISPRYLYCCIEARDAMFPIPSIVVEPHRYIPHHLTSSAHCYSGQAS